MSPSEEYLSVPQSQYERLLRVERVYQALRRAGVDNWSGYDYAMELLDDEE